MHGLYLTVVINWGDLLGILTLPTLFAGAVLTKTNLTKSLFPNPTQYKTARYPKILLTTDEMQEIRNVQPKGEL